MMMMMMTGETGHVSAVTLTVTGSSEACLKNTSGDIYEVL